MPDIAALKPEEIRQFPYRGLSTRHRPLVASEATVDEASRRLFGDIMFRPVKSAHRGELLRYLLRALYGSDYVRRGAVLLGCSENVLSKLMCTGLRVSRARVQRLEVALEARRKRRRLELRLIAGVIEQAFSREQAMLDDTPAVLSDLSRLASLAARWGSDRGGLPQPIDARSGRFVSRKNRKVPELREKPVSR